MKSFLLLAVVGPALASAASLGIVTVRTTEACKGPLPVAVDLPAGVVAAETKALSLHPDEGTPLPGQVTVTPAGARVEFVVPEGLVAGARREYRLEEALPDTKAFSTTDKDGAVRIDYDGHTLAAWQWKTLADPKGGEKFPISAYLHPVRTVSGFPVTALQPKDHLHHLGVWWPWKMVEVDGKSYITWEMQEGQGRHFSEKAPAVQAGPVFTRLTAAAVTEIHPKDAPPKVVIDEESTITAWRPAGNIWLLDIRVRQKARDGKVTLPAYRYSGFSLRATESWTKDNSQLLTSEGQNRENANGQTARWAVVGGQAPSGQAAVLMLSAAGAKGDPEKLRVWDSKAQNGMSFVNFNPVLEKPMPLDEAHPAVSDRSYRLVVADRALEAAEAEALWKTMAHPPEASFHK